MCRWARHHRLAVASLVVLTAIVLFSSMAGHLIPYRFDTLTPDRSQPPSLHHLMGTDGNGHDLFSQVLRGALRSMQVGLLVAALSTTIGVTVGTAAGYYGGWIDELVGRVIDFALIIPGLAVLVVAANNLTRQRGNWALIASVIALVTWPGTARLVRAVVQSLYGSGFVEASRALGASDPHVIGRHVLPNAASVIIISAVLAMTTGVLAEAALTFLGLGVSPPDVSLGKLVANGQAASTTRPWLFYFPGAVLVLIVLCVNFVGDGIRDTLDPRSTHRNHHRAVERLGGVPPL